MLGSTFGISDILGGSAVIFRTIYRAYKIIDLRSLPMPHRSAPSFSWTSHAPFFFLEVRKSHHLTAWSLPWAPASQSLRPPPSSTKKNLLLVVGLDEHGVYLDLTGGRGKQVAPVAIYRYQQRKNHQFTFSASKYCRNG